MSKFQNLYEQVLEEDTLTFPTLPFNVDLSKTSKIMITIPTEAMSKSRGDSTDAILMVIMGNFNEKNAWTNFGVLDELSTEMSAEFDNLEKKDIKIYFKTLNYGWFAKLFVKMGFLPKEVPILLAFVKDIPKKEYTSWKKYVLPSQIFNKLLDDLTAGAHYTAN